MRKGREICENFSSGKNNLSYRPESLVQGKEKDDWMKEKTFEFKKVNGFADSDFDYLSENLNQQIYPLFHPSHSSLNLHFEELVSISFFFFSNKKSSPLNFLRLKVRKV
jgi:hypothetical protein